MRDPFLVFTYDTLTRKGKDRKGVPYPLNCFIVSSFLFLLLLLPYAIEGELFNKRIWEEMKHPFFFIVLFVLPAGLIVLDQIYKKYKTTLKELRNVVRESNEEYQKFVQITNWTFQSPAVYSFWIFIISILLVFEINFGYAKPPEQIERFGNACFFLVAAIIWIITVSIEPVS